MRIECEQCGKSVEKSTGHVNRARKFGRKLFCSRACFGLSRRRGRTKEELVEAKRLYDIEYRRKNQEKLKANKREWFQRTYDPEKARIERKKRSAEHAEYCRRPEYKAWKREYDKRYRAKKNFGEFWEAHLLLVDIETELRPQKYEIALANGQLNKAKRRKRECQQITNSLPRI